MAIEAVNTYVCDRCGKTAPEVPPNPANGEMSNAPIGWNRLMLQNLRVMGQRSAEVCDTCSATVMPDFWKEKTSG